MNLITLNLTHAKARQSRHHLLSEVTSILARWVGLDSISRAERTLNGMTDELLADIGIKRSEIDHAVRYGRSDDDRSVQQAKIISLHRPTNRPDGGPDVPRAA
jgi:uncharacterized protein YjiS (DUF1127 family)